LKKCAPSSWNCSSRQLFQAAGQDRPPAEVHRRFKAKASKAKQAQSRVKALERMEKIAPVLADADFTFEFKEPPTCPTRCWPLATPRLATCAKTAAETTIVQNVSRSVLAGQRIGILGANGQGKSTLVKTIARTMAPLAGTITEGKGLSIGYFAQQELDVLRPHENPLEHMVRLAASWARQPRTQPRAGFAQLPGQLQLHRRHGQAGVGSMSGGEKARLVLAMIVWQRPNLLLLDEPTNHLDLATREALSMALNEFEGTVMLVSHDRALLRAVCDEFWMVGRGAVRPVRRRPGRLPALPARRSQAPARTGQDRGGCTAASRRCERGPAHPGDRPFANGGQGSDAGCQGATQAGRPGTPATDEKLRPYKRELEQVDKRLAELVEERRVLESRLTQALPPAEIADCGRRLKTCNDETQALEERWLELSSQLETVSSAA
jgi:ATP-binding cassette subfamily F protein 3